MDKSLIMRQAAMDAVRDYPDDLISQLTAIEDLPSVEPEIIRCKDCNNWDTTWQNDWAKDYHYCPVIDGVRNGDWYCADAERRNDGSD